MFHTCSTEQVTGLSVVSFPNKFPLCYGMQKRQDAHIQKFGNSRTVMITKWWPMTGSGEREIFWLSGQEGKLSLGDLGQFHIVM